jgi:glucosamine--fructose-6-phosphate aminotransferase (isomerizing)
MFATPSLYTIYEQPPRLEGAIVIGISQSGASPDIISVLAEARRQGRPTIALTNDAASPLAQQADAVLPLEAGHERAVAATKTYLNSVGAVALLFATISEDELALDELKSMPEVLERQIALSLESFPSLDGYRDAVGATVVARGVNYGTAYEIALKIRELSGLVVEAYSPADLLHGPIAAIQPGWPVVVVAPTGPARPSVEEVVVPLKERGARVLAVSDVAAVLRRADTRLPLVPRVPEWLSPLTAVIPGQVAGMRLAQLRGLDIDSPRGLAKVTLTR